MVRRKKTSVWKWSLMLIGGLVAAFLLLCGLVAFGAFGRLPSRAELAAIRNEEATLVLAADGTIIGKVFAKDRTNVAFTDLPTGLIDALLATEDRRFFEHEGVDARSYLRVLLRTIFSGDRSGGGGSTISQQIIKNLYGREPHGLLTLPVNKIKEAIVAHRLEQVYNKQQVLALYFNSVPFGENVFGIETAARRFFSRSASGLHVEEAAMLVGMLKANTFYNPRLYPDNARARRDQVIRLMQERGSLSARDADSLAALPVKLRYAGLDALDIYAYFSERVSQEARTILHAIERRNGTPHDLEKDGLRIHTTLDTELQHMAMEAARDQLAQMQPKLDRELRSRRSRAAWERGRSRKADRAWKRNARSMKEVFDWLAVRTDTMTYRDSLWHYQKMLNGAVMMMESRTGRVLAWVGGNHHRYLPFDLVQAHRPIASTIKPVLYAAALEQGMEPCTYLANKDSIYIGLDDWHPRNFDDSTGGEVAMWYALAHSINLATLDLYFRTGPAAIGAMMRRLGLPAKSAEHPAMALGAADISLEEITSAYGAFATGGRMVRPRFIERITDASGKVIYNAPPPKLERVMDGSTAAQVTAMLQRAVNEGTGSTLRSRFNLRSALAGKTGTSQDYSDAWFVGFTPEVVVATWVGANDPAMHFQGIEGSGSRLALPIVGRLLADMERSSDLRRKYLRPFDWLEGYEVDMDCRPVRSTSAVDEFFRDLFGPKQKGAPAQPRDSADKPRKEGFFKRLFKKRS